MTHYPCVRSIARTVAYCTIRSLLGLTMLAVVPVAGGTVLVVMMVLLVPLLPSSLSVRIRWWVMLSSMVLVLLVSLLLVRVMVSVRVVSAVMALVVQLMIATMPAVPSGVRALAVLVLVLTYTAGGTRSLTTPFTTPLMVVMRDWTTTSTTCTDGQMGAVVRGFVSCTEGPMSSHSLE